MTAKKFSIKVIKNLLQQNNCLPRKSLGQNFLTDENTLKKIAAAADLSKQDLVLEIGPGLGALTEILMQEAGRVIAVEYDRNLFGILQKEFLKRENLQLLNQDILKTDLPALFHKEDKLSYGLKVVANLPYYITTPIIFKILETKLPWQCLVFLVQKEVAQRICATSGGKDYGALTIMLQFLGRTDLIGTVSRKVFYPAPNVDSAIVRIIPEINEETYQIYPYLYRVVQAAFNQRRKTLLNSLATASPFFGDKVNLERLLVKLKIDPRWRGENLTVAQFVALAGELRQREKAEG